MPRISPWLFRKARRHSVHAVTLLPACRDLQSAINELRWIREYVNATTRKNQATRLLSLCRGRGRGVPLQYILGSQPFGSLEIKCRPGVLIPRPETEAYTCYLVNLIKAGKLPGRHHHNSSPSLNIVDFCTGTGCIPLLLFSSLQRSVNQLNVLGVDISASAVKLAHENITHNIKTGHIFQPSPGQSLRIIKGDIFNSGDVRAIADKRWDIMVSNPPYISRDTWKYGRGQLGLSVRRFEPILALVPDDNLHIPPRWAHEDIYYARLLDLAAMLGPKVVLFEVGDEAQACRVLKHFFRHNLSRTASIEVWRDWPDLIAIDDKETSLSIINDQGRRLRISVKGSGQVRSLVINSLV